MNVVEKDVENPSSTKENVRLDKLVLETFETPDNKKSHLSIVEAEMETEPNEKLKPSPIQRKLLVPQKMLQLLSKSKR